MLEQNLDTFNNENVNFFGKFQKFKENFHTLKNKSNFLEEKFIILMK